MISKIKHISSKKILEVKLNYNETKIEKGVGSLILDNTLSEKRGERLTAFNDVFDSNKNVKSNFAFEVSLNFPHGENVTDEKFKEVLGDYITKMGYENAPYVCYRHDDKLHQHYHIIISHVDWEGKKIPQYNMFLKSQKISRELELKHGLRLTEYTKNITNESLNAINARKYYFSNALVSGLKSYNTKNYLQRNLSEEQIKKILGYEKKCKTLTNQQISVLLGKKAEVIKSYLSENGMFNVLLKNELYKNIENIYKKSENKIEFINNLEKENIYVRKLFNKNQSPYLVYGLKDMSFYIKDRDLSKKFSYSNLFEIKNNTQNENFKKVFGIEEQKKYIKTIVKRVLRESNSLKEFAEKLNLKGVELITYQNKKGIYGVSYKSINVENPEIFKGSDVNLSWDDVYSQLQLNEQAAVKEIIYNEIPNSIEINNHYLPYIPENAVMNKGQEAEDFLSKKKKKKKKDMGL